MLPKTRKNLRDTKETPAAEYPLAIAVALHQELGGSRQAIKKLARWTGASERTVQNWMSAVRGPSGPHLVVLARHCAAVHSALLALSGRENKLDTDISASVALLREATALLTACLGQSGGASRASGSDRAGAPA